MFGLGVGELLLLVGVIALIGGPAAVVSMARAFKTVNKAKSELTGQAILGKILEDDDDDERPRRKKKRRAKKRKKKATRAS